MTDDIKAQAPPAGADGRGPLHFVLLGMLAMLVLVNIVQFRAIDSRTSDRYKALHRYDTHDIRVLAQDESRADVEWFGPALALAGVAPGSTLTMPDQGAYTRNYFRQKMYALGEVERIDYRSYDPSGVFDHGSVKKHVVASGKDGGRRGPAFSVAMKSASARQFILLLGKDGEEWLVDVALLPAQVWEGLEG